MKRTMIQSPALVELCEQVLQVGFYAKKKNGSHRIIHVLICYFSRHMDIIPHDSWKFWAAEHW